VFFTKAVFLVKNLDFMKTAIIYMSSHGTVTKIVNQLANQLSGEIQLYNMREDNNVDIEHTDRIIIGGSIHAGKLQHKIRKFCEKNQNNLLTKELGLFICCMYEGPRAMQQLQEAYPLILHQHAKAETIMGGEFKLTKLNPLERFLVKRIAKTTTDVEKLDKQAFQKFVLAMEKGTIN